MEIRRATHGDADDIGRVHAGSRRAAYAGILPRDALAMMTDERQAAYWRARLADEPDPYALHVCVAHGRVAGFVLGTRQASTATLNALHVLPELLGTGAGQRLHDAVLVDFASWDRAEAVLWVLEDNARAQSFYRRNGWALDGERGRHDIGGAEATVVRYRRAVPAQVQA